MTLALPASMTWSPSAASAACVPTSTATWTVWPSSERSACDATSAPSLRRLSNTTRSRPPSRLASKEISTSRLPVESAGANSALASTGMPEASATGSPVALSTRVAESSYSSPAFSPS